MPRLHRSLPQPVNYFRGGRREAYVPRDQQPEGRPSPADRMQLIARLEALSDEERGRLFVTTVLTKEFGEEFANDPKLLSASSHVYDALSRDEAGRALIPDALGQMLDPQRTSDDILVCAFALLSLAKTRQDKAANLMGYCPKFPDR